jgi:hypothetical protein
MGDARALHAEVAGDPGAEVEHPTAGKGAAVPHHHHGGSAIGRVRHLQHGPEGQVPVRRRVAVRVESLAIGHPPAREVAGVVAGPALDHRS